MGTSKTCITCKQPLVGPRKYCSPECYYKSRKRITRSLEDRFWKYVEKTPDCWLWIGKLYPPDGRGKLSVRIGFKNQKPVLAHRISWELHNGKIPEGPCVCHE